MPSTVGRENQRVKNQVFFRDAIFFGQQLVGTLGDFQLAFASDCLGLLFVIVNAANYQGRAVGLGQGGHCLEASLAVLQVY